MSEAHWRVVVDDRARKDLRRIDPPTRDSILRAIERVAQGAELAGDVKRLRGSGEYLLRVGDWRVRLNETIASSRSWSCGCYHVAARMTVNAIAAALGQSLTLVRRDVVARRAAMPAGRHLPRRGGADRAVSNGRPPMTERRVGDTAALERRSAPNEPGLGEALGAHALARLERAMHELEELRRRVGL